jgi:Tfp pilus assembly protein PilO
MVTTAEMTAWRLRRLLRSMGWPAIGGVGLALFAAGLLVSGIMPLRAEVALLRDRVQALEVPPAPGRAHMVEQQHPREQLDAFYSALAPARQAPDIVRRLHGHARAAGLSLDRGEYRPQPDASGGLVRYQIVLPVRGGYPQVKDFLARVMRATPGLALDSVGFQREEGSAALEVQLRFTVFLRIEA